MYGVRYGYNFSFCVWICACPAPFIEMAGILKVTWSSPSSEEEVWTTSVESGLGKMLLVAFPFSHAIAPTCSPLDSLLY